MPELPWSLAWIVASCMAPPSLGQAASCGGDKITSLSVRDRTGFLFILIQQVSKGLGPKAVPGAQASRFQAR